MNNITELNQNEISAVTGGSKLGDCLGWAGAVVGAYLYVLEQKRGNTGKSITEFYTRSLLYTSIIGATWTTLSIIGFQLSCSFVFATAGNIVTALYEKIIGRTE